MTIANDEESQEKPFLYIAAGVLRAADGRVLIAKRRPGKPGAGKWEFPGGKREPGEAVSEALARELDEELGVHVRETRPLIRFAHDYSDRRVLLDIHLVESWGGEAYGREGQELAWSRPERLDEYDLLSANTPVVAALRLPSRYLITPAPDDDTAGFMAAAERALGAGLRLLRLRAWHLDDDAYEALARELQALAAVHDAALLLDRDAAMVERVGAAGLHLPARALRSLKRRPLSPGLWLGVSCHDRADLERAIGLGADFATLSPGAATPSHPDAVPLGGDGVARAREGLALPVYALGGVGPGECDAAREAGAQGVAGIRAFWPGR